MSDHSTNGASNTPRSRFGPGWVVVSRPGAVHHTEILPLEGEFKESLTVRPPRLPPSRGERSLFDENGYLKPWSGPRERSLFDENGYLKPPRPQRPANLRWWERLAWAWRGL